MTSLLSGPTSDVASRIIAGSILPGLVRHVTQNMIDAYAEASGDFNPIHVDPVYSRSGPFGRTVAHGLMTLAFVAHMLNDWSEGYFDVCGSVDVTFVGPVFVDDTVEISGRVEDVFDRDGTRCARIKVMCQAGGRQILAGFAVQPIGNERS